MQGWKTKNKSFSATEPMLLNTGKSVSVSSGYVEK